MWIRMPSSLVQNKKRNEPSPEPQGTVYIKWLCRKQEPKMIQKVISWICRVNKKREKYFKWEPREESVS